MTRRQEPQWLLERLPPRHRREVADAVRRGGISTITADTVGGEMAGGYLLQVGRRRVTVPDSATGAARAAKLSRFVSILEAAWAAEIRASLIELAGRTLEDPPAWAWRCSQLLRNALAAAGVRSEELARSLGQGGPAGHVVTITIPPRVSWGAHLKPLTMSVQRPPVGARLRTTIELAPGLTYREAGDRTYGTTRSELIATRCQLSHTVMCSLPPRGIETVHDHPLLRRAEYVIERAWRARGCSRVRFAMPERSLARLPAEVAALRGITDRSNLAMDPWR